MRTLALLLAAGLVVTACSKQPDPEPTALPTTESPSPTPTEAPAFPLTGVESDDPLLDQPVLSVKIDNHATAQPFAGLDMADMVFEQLVEGGATRFLALFHSTIPDEVGPVRSARLVDVPLLEPLSTVLLYSGARKEVRSALQDATVALLPDDGGPIYRRDPGRPGVHDLMADLSTVLERAMDMDEVAPVPDDVPWAFDEEAPGDGTEETSFELRLSNATRTGWEWDEDEEVWRRSSNGNPSQVTGDGQIGAANVVAIQTDVGTGGCCDTAGQPYVVTRLDGTGDAVIWRDGQRFEATWRKPEVGDHLELLTPDGDPFPLAPGSTWFHLAEASAVPELAVPSDEST